MEVKHLFFILFVINFVCAIYLGEGVCDNDFQPTANNTWCYKFHSQKKTWIEADEECKLDNSNLIHFQPKYDWDLDSMTSGVKDTFLWIGLRRINHVFHWVGGQLRMLKKGDEFGQHWASNQPLVWNGCGVVNKSSGELHTKTCDVRELTFICIKRPQTNSGSVKPIWNFIPEFSNVSVKIVAFDDIFHTVLTDDDYFLWVRENDLFSTLLKCKITINGTENEFVENQTDITITWLKNGVAMPCPPNAMYPYQWLMPTPWPQTIGRIKDFLGTYQCEVHIRGYKFQSKPLSLFIKGLHMMKYRIEVDWKKKINVRDFEPSLGSALTFETWKDEVEKIAGEILPLNKPKEVGARNLEWMLHYISPVDETERSSGTITKKILISMFVAVNKTIDNIDSLEETKLQLNEYAKAVSKKSTEISLLGHCKESIDVVNGRTYVWTLNFEKSRGLSNPVCVSDKPKIRIVSRRCNGTYSDEAKFEKFDYSLCSLKISHLFEDEFCPPGHKMMSDDICLIKRTTKTNWTSAMAECTRLGSHLPHNERDVISPRDTQRTTIFSWSVARMNGRRIYPPRADRSSEGFNLTNCVVLNSSHSPTWQRMNCKQKQPFVCVSRIQDSLWKVPWCPRGWLGTEIPSLKNICYFINASFVAPELIRKRMCLNHGAELVNTSIPLIHFLVRGTVAAYQSRSHRNKRFIDDSFFVKIDFLVCQKLKNLPVPRKPVLLLRHVQTAIKENEKIELICHGSNVRPNSRIVWYHNGDPYPADLEQNSPTNTDYLASAIVNLDKSQQGDYWCETWDNTAKEPVASNRVTLAIPSVNNCVIVLKPGNSSLPDLFELSNVSSFFNKAEPNVIKQEATLLDDGQLVVWVHINSYLTQEDAVRKIGSGFNKHLSEISHNITANLPPIIVRSTEWCLTVQTTLPDRNVLVWPQTKRNRVSLPQQLCFTFDFQPVYRECLGDFRRGAFWGPVIGSCTGKPSQLTENLFSLSQSQFTKDNAFNKSNSLHQLTYFTKVDFQPVDIAYIASTMKKISDTGNVTNETFKNVLETVNVVMNVESDKVLHSRSSNKITESLENMVETVDLEPGSHLQYTFPNIHVESHLIAEEKSSKPIIGIASYNHAHSTLTAGDQLNYSNVDVALVLPVDLVEERKNIYGSTGGRLSFFVYHGSQLFNPRNGSINSKIVSAQLPGPAASNLPNPVELVFKPVRRTSLESVSCTYWDPDLNKGRGDWSTAGCWVVSVQKEVIVCKCNHLTNFAVLVDFYGQDQRVVGMHRRVLDTITYIGCAFSIFGLSMTILTFLLFNKWRKKDGNKIVFNLALSLLLLMVTFLAGIEQTSNPAICQAVAILLHYFILVAFCWMLIEAIQQYLLFVRVLATYIPRFLLKSILFAWGVPLVIVITVIGIDIDQYQGGVHYCWMKLDALYYAFLLPLGIIIVINTVVFILVLRGITRGRRTKLRSNQSKQQLMKTQLYAAMFIFVLLGLSWVFGFFALESARLAFQYIFCISNSLQGLFIFLFMVVRDRNAQDLWQSLCVSKATKRTGITTSGTQHHRKGEPNSDNFTTKMMVSRTSTHPSQ